MLLYHAGAAARRAPRGRRRACKQRVRVVRSAQRAVYHALQQNSRVRPISAARHMLNLRCHRRYEDYATAR